MPRRPRDNGPASMAMSELFRKANRYLADHGEDYPWGGGRSAETEGGLHIRRVNDALEVEAAFEKPKQIGEAVVMVDETTFVEWPVDMRELPNVETSWIEGPNGGLNTVAIRDYAEVAHELIALIED